MRSAWGCRSNVVLLCLLFASCATTTPAPAPAPVKAETPPDHLRHWRATDFPGAGAVRFEGDTIILEMGNDLTGVNWTGPLLRMDYEITLDAMRVDGNDFFCGLTFPYGDDPCSLIVGGWGGTCVGLSSLDFNDAYNNETARFITFETGRWYRIRLRATKAKIEAWIDGNQIVDVETEGRKIGIRFEVERSKPLGVSSWRTTAAIRNFQQRPITDASAP